MTAALDRLHARSEHVSDSTAFYGGNRPVGGKEASASASGNLARLLKDVGMTAQRPQPVGIVKWRASQVYLDKGVQRAWDISGRSSLNATLDFIRQPAVRPVVRQRTSYL